MVVSCLIFNFLEQAEIDADASKIFEALLDMNNWSVRNLFGGVKIRVMLQ